MIQSWLSTWLRDLQSETCKEKRSYIIDLSDEYIFGYVQRVLTSAEVLFSPPENSIIASGEVNTILFITRKGIPVNTILLSPSAHSMADARHDTLFSALNIPFRLQNQLLFCTDTKI